MPNDNVLTDERRIELAIFHRILGRDGNGDATRSYGSKDDVLNLCRAIEREVLAAHPGQPESHAAALVPCPICGSEAIGHISMLERVTIAPEPRAEVTDKARMDWLCERVVNVRDPYPLGGSRDLFWASPHKDDSGFEPSDLRAKIDAARTGASS